MSKFIHHERITSEWMGEEEGFDVVEDSDGFKVYENSMVMAERDTLEEAIEEAERLLAVEDQRHAEDVERRRIEALPPYFQLRTFSHDGSAYDPEVYDDTDSEERRAYADFAAAMIDEDVASARLYLIKGETVCHVAAYDLAGIAETRTV
jgi:hypothetical protein